MEQVRKIEWKRGYSYHIDPEVAYAEVEKIRSGKDGKLTGADVFAAAQDPENPLHPEVFDKDREHAADAYYLSRATGILRALTIRVVGGPNEPVRVYPVIGTLKSETAKSRSVSVFSNIEDALRDPVQRQVVIANAIAELGAFRKKYAALSELAVLWPVVDEVVTTLTA